MTQDQVAAYVRTACTALGVLAGAGGLFSAFGLTLNADQIGTIQTGLLGVVSLAFLAYSLFGSWRAHSTTGIITSAASVPGTQIVTQPAIAQAAPANVVSSDDHRVTPQAPVAASDGAPVVIPGGH